MRTSLTVVAILAAVLAACGDDADDVGAGDVTTTTTANTAATSGGAQTTTTTAVSQTTSAGGATVQCGTVGFTPNSEDAAGDIRATGPSCDEARAFVRVAGSRTSSGGPQELDVEGYHCVRTRTEQEPLPQAFYECTNGPDRITFVRS